MSFEISNHDSVGDEAALFVANDTGLWVVSSFTGNTI